MGVEEKLRHREGREEGFLVACRIGICTDGIRNVRRSETAIVLCSRPDGMETVITVSTLKISFDYISSIISQVFLVSGDPLPL